MTPKQIGEAYDQITQLWTRQEFNRENGIAQHKRALAFVLRKENALDVGCGCTGRFIDLLQGEGFEVEGVDISQEKIRLARERNPELNFYHVDICEWDLPRHYDFITAWDSIWHIPLSEQRPVLSKLVAGLNPGGVLIFSFGGVDEPGEHTDSTMGPEVYYSSLGTTGFIELFVQLGCHIRHVEFDQYPELHTYLIVQKPQE